MLKTDSPTPNEKPSEKKIEPAIVVALIGALATIIAAWISRPNSLAPPTSISSEMAPASTPALISYSTPAPSASSISTLSLGCEGVEVYLELNNLLTGNKLIGCSSQKGNSVTLLNKDIDGLANLTGRIKGSDIADSNICDWGWYVNINTRPNPLDENCRFSIDLNQNNIEKIFIENASKSIVFTIQIER